MVWHKSIYATQPKNDCSAVAKCTKSALRYCQTQRSTTAATRRPEVHFRRFAVIQVLQTVIFHFPCSELASEESVKEMLEEKKKKYHQGSIGTGAPLSSPSYGAPGPVHYGTTAIIWSRHVVKYARQSWGSTDKHAMCKANLISASRSREKGVGINTQIKTEHLHPRDDSM